MGDWLGTGTVANRGMHFRPFLKARAFARSLALKNQKEWHAFAKSTRKPKDIPYSPATAYAVTGWTGYGDWLGTGNKRGGKKMRK